MKEEKKLLCNSPRYFKNKEQFNIDAERLNNFVL